MSEPNPVIETIAELECPWCRRRFEGKLLRFDMAFMGRIVNLSADPLCPACRRLAEQQRAAERSRGCGCSGRTAGSVRCGGPY